MSLFKGLTMVGGENTNNEHTILNKITRMKKVEEEKVHKFSCWQGANTPCVCKIQKFLIFCLGKHPMVHVK